MNGDNLKSKDVQATSIEKLSEFLEGYRTYSSTLRTWIAGFASGIPAFLALNADAWSKLLASGKIACIFQLLFVAVISQIAGALLYKHVNSIGYLVDVRNIEKESMRAKFAEYFGSAIWPDLLLDVVGVVASAIAAWNVLIVISGQ